MATDDLKSFKISDQQKPTVDQPRPRAGAGGKGKAEPAPSVGFPRIEALVESATPDFQGLEERHAQLSELASTGASNKEKAAAKKALTAYEKARDLIDYLLETKAGMGAGSPKG